LAEEDADKGSLEGGEAVEEERVGEEGVNRLAEDSLKEVERGGAPPQQMFAGAFTVEAEGTSIFQWWTGAGWGRDGGGLVFEKGVSLEKPEA